MGKKQSCSSRFVGISSSIHLNESVCVCVGGRCVCAQSDFEFKQQSPPKITTKQKRRETITMSAVQFWVGKQM